MTLMNFVLPFARFPLANRSKVLKWRLRSRKVHVIITNTAVSFSCAKSNMLLQENPRPTRVPGTSADLDHVFSILG